VVPPNVGVAINVMEFPAHTGFWDGEIATLTGRLGLTIIVIPLDVAGLFEMHTVNEDVRTQVTITLFNGV
jgi:hypothetical protein